MKSYCVFSHARTRLVWDMWQQLLLIQMGNNEVKTSLGIRDRIFRLHSTLLFYSIPSFYGFNFNSDSKPQIMEGRSKAWMSWSSGQRQLLPDPRAKRNQDGVCGRLLTIISLRLGFWNNSHQHAGDKVACGSLFTNLPIN